MRLLLAETLQPNWCNKEEWFDCVFSFYFNTYCQLRKKEQKGIEQKRHFIALKKNFTVW